MFDKKTKEIKSEQECLKVLNIDSFNEMNTNKMKEFISVLPRVDKDVSKEVIGNIPNVLELMKEIVDITIKSNDKSMEHTMVSYSKILDSLIEQVKDGNLNQEQKMELNKLMIEVADKKGLKDTENKKWLFDMVKNVGVTVGIVVVGALIVGANTKDDNKR